MPFEQLFEPAIRYAEQGFPVSPFISMLWKRAEKRYLPLTGAEFAPQSALDAPRWQFVKSSTVLVEQTVASKIVEELQKRGHDIVPSPPEFFGRGQIISKHNQVLIAASEPRTDGLAVAW